MAWNTTRTTSLGPSDSKTAQTPLGAPVATNPGLAGRGYKDGWDIERAYREGMQKVTWVYRCIDAIASNQARLPAILRDNNSPDGRIVTGSNNEVLKLLNTKPNVGENSFVFRYRLSAQVLMSTRGVFIEKIEGRDGRLIGLHLLPPQHTAPIPDPKKFVAGYEVTLNGGGREIIPAEKVVWIRRPHPLDPYRSLTPMESAGVAIEIENLAKLYNRNFLLNDGRPGGLLVVRGDMEDDDKEELRSRFRGNLNRAGAVSVIASEDGVDFVDTASSPRDASYIEMRNLTKEEILTAFGVPESAIGNAAGRTFSNASEELRVFWMETMMPHLDLLGRGLDELDDRYYVDFNTDEVPILVLFRQERERYLMNEHQAGLISGNEYRTGTGRKKIESELMDSMLANPNLTPIGNTEKKFEMNQQQPVDMAGVEGAPTPAPPPGPLTQGGAAGAAAGNAPTSPTAATPEVAPPEPPAAPPAPAKTDDGRMQFKSLTVDTKVPDEWDVKAEQSVDRWTEILDRSLERYFDRQQRVVLEKATGAKARKALAAGNLDVANVFDVEVWNRQLNEDIRPMLQAIAEDAAKMVEEQSGGEATVTKAEMDAYVDDQMERVQQANQTTREEISSAILTALAMGGDEEGHPLLKLALLAIFMHLMKKRRREIAEHEAQTAFNAGVYVAASKRPNMMKTWKTRRDSHVRSAHMSLEGKTVPITDGFIAGEHLLRFPGDPLAPPSLTINCRCRLKFST